MKKKGEAPIQVLTHYIILTNRDGTDQISCLRFRSSQFCRIVKNLTISLMIYNHSVFPTGQYCLEIWPGYASIIYEYADSVMLYLGVPNGKTLA